MTLMDTTTRTISADISSTAAAVARCMIAALFLKSGIDKALAPDGTVQLIASTGLPWPMVGYGGALVLEVGGATALILGYRTAVFAWLLAIYSLTTAAIFHSQFADANQAIHFLKNVSIAGGLVQLALTGPGRLSVDAGRSGMHQ